MGGEVARPTGIVIKVCSKQFQISYLTVVNGAVVLKIEGNEFVQPGKGKF